MFAPVDAALALVRLADVKSWPRRTPNELAKLEANNIEDIDNRNVARAIRSAEAHAVPFLFVFIFV
jgi:hypothetical protein